MRLVVTHRCSYFLPRLQGSVGMYIALLGARLKAADCIHTGIATHYVHSSKLSELKVRDMPCLHSAYGLRRQHCRARIRLTWHPWVRSFRSSAAHHQVRNTY